MHYKGTNARSIYLLAVTLIALLSVSYSWFHIDSLELKKIGKQVAICFSIAYTRCAFNGEP